MAYHIDINRGNIFDLTRTRPPYPRHTFTSLVLIMEIVEIALDRLGGKAVGLIAEAVRYRDHVSGRLGDDVGDDDVKASREFLSVASKINDMMGMIRCLRELVAQTMAPDGWIGAIGPADDDGLDEAAPPVTSFPPSLRDLSRRTDAIYAEIAELFMGLMGPSSAFAQADPTA